MLKALSKRNLIILFLFAFVLLILHVIRSYSLKYRPNIQTIHVINLDKDIERLTNIQNAAKSAGLPVERWKAITGKDYTQDQLAALGVGYVITNSGKGTYKEQRKLENLRNLGSAGCFLSHRTLLEHLQTLNVPDDYGHLILEDDVNIPQNFLDTWSNIQSSVPMDWDILYLDIAGPRGRNINAKVQKLKYTKGIEGGNWGTHAYVVRHGFIKTMLPWLEYMIDCIDQQYKRQFNTWNVYALVPGIITLHAELSADENSSIQKEG